MIDDFELNELKKNPEWRAALQMYHDLQVASREQSPDADGWIPRPAELIGVDSQRLSSVHGKLIAFGFLKFDVSGRDIGVRYQLTPQGRRALFGETADSEESSPASEWSESA
jgi:hypothetical protein